MWVSRNCHGKQAGDTVCYRWDRREALVSLATQTWHTSVNGPFSNPGEGKEEDRELRRGAGSEPPALEL